MAKVVIKKQRSKLSNMLIAFLKRFHLLIFFIVVVAILSVAVIMLNQTLTDTSQQQYTSNINAGSIDQTTLQRIQSLHTSSKPTNPNLPSGRINPFAE